MDVIINGAAGRMGHVLAGLEGFAGSRVVAKVDRAYERSTNALQFSSLADVPADGVVLDFSNHTGTEQLLATCVERGLPVVIATTGHTPEERALVEQAARSVPMFFAPNMSLGVALLMDLARTVAAALPDAQIEIVEAHHDQKLDVPSGTALGIARAIQEVRPNATLNVGRHENGKRTNDEIGIHSLRIGTVVGVHEVLVSTGAETITLKHEAHDRALFAQGALRAAAFLAGQGPGLYGMRDLIAH
ncbi:4-hydroxy-tetrahydrodipicolinate reductase [Olsenella sp. YH-ols2217]|uniref:4-hydroxy-tetrahydrodipicolinate reductase n=1 Tax=Kribbibacterium absianum TaxID=3044210 RepID=A0ABT6ZIH2_9ACTN|nr:MULTISPECIES: 4-hydroxy-tetrahydrodipicolinate reductase [unclassified Olsenella]MDJ1121355.1 4-hydroxy-tetrahydrodipicolinate reductase [Olsenella sp. YH-ols2216]MDJ1128845.1 4-hydroxy-tetrahydrodipicolinate reductase [Olsenella sp. YH-ols2217]